MSEVYISTAFLFALRQNAGETPAIRWSRLLFRIDQAFSLQKKVMQALKDRTRRRIAGVSPTGGCTQPLMSEVLISNAFLFAYRQSAGETPAIRWSRLLFRITQAFRLQKKVMQALKDRTRRRIAGVSPAGGCTQPLLSEFISQPIFLFALRQSAGETPVFMLNFCNKKIVPLVPQKHNLINKFP